MRWNLALAGLASSWGLIAVLVAAVELDAAALAFLRLAFAAGALGLVALASGRLRALRPGRRLPALVALGVVQGAHWLLFFEAVKLGSVALAVLTFYAAPVFLAVLAPLALAERLSNVALGALVPGGAGIALVALGSGEGGGANGWAIASGLGSAATYAALVILSKRLLADRAEPLTVAFWDCLVGGIAVAPALLVAGRVMPDGGREWGAVLLLGVVFTGVSTLVYAGLLRHVTAQAAGLLTFLEPVAAVVLAWALVDERPTVLTFAGGALVLLAGIAVVALEPTEARVAEAAAGVGSTSS
ncbi:EamA-like transporter family [Gaiella occulta]|uniref:EamA-like transporter family n=1 Tax=Gaiella occulta TaxID=1002870 RepID=A0A7M2YYK0_9ACTN|nr:EamA family transporter [Gaiella occulta]RDI75237.1 EamA-like transporter family [Gaiella occulta]